MTKFLFYILAVVLFYYALPAIISNRSKTSGELLME